ncbi:ECF sigma factor [Planctomycetes bacterium Poly30]|uniref:ECF sigma factor n=1 Tax=Saltatorellus ferox TaxID=2528018 RepID=A0A518ESX1_9BACT|nr:ECF sigma factor [Planctomycetes bacterium Poly30]
MPGSSDDITRILKAGPDGRRDVLPLVYEELRAIARRRMRLERANHTLQATALVHEAYGKLLNDDLPSWEDRREFYAAAARAMQRVLIDHARKHQSEKRGGRHLQVTLGVPEAPVPMDSDRIVALGDALATLAREDDRAAEVARLRFLVGLTVEETARTMGMSERNVAREWSFARARLTSLIHEQGA